MNFNSCLKDYLNSFISQKIKDGYKETSFGHLSSFDNFLIKNNIVTNTVTKEIADKYLEIGEKESTANLSKRSGNLKSFSEYLNSIGVSAYVPRNSIKRNKVRPYVLTSEEIAELFKAIDKYFLKQEKVSTYYSFMIPVILRLLYCTGMRINEACTLTYDDIDFENNRFHLKNGKNNKDRYVYFHKDIRELLNVYLSKMKNIKKSEWIFPACKSNTHIQKTYIDKHFLKIIKSEEIGSDNFYPTPHSLRHSFTVHKIDEWDRNGKNVDELMPYLSKQLGHSSPLETYYYYHSINTSFDTIREKDRNLFPEVEANV